MCESFQMQNYNRDLHTKIKGVVFAIGPLQNPRIGNDDEEGQ